MKETMFCRIIANKRKWIFNQAFTLPRYIVFYDLCTYVCMYVCLRVVITFLSFAIFEIFAIFQFSEFSRFFNFRNFRDFCYFRDFHEFRDMVFLRDFHERRFVKSGVNVRDHNFGDFCTFFGKKLAILLKPNVLISNFGDFANFRHKIAFFEKNNVIISIFA
jgi:hypothetical protein